MADPARAMKVADRIKTVTAEGLGQVIKDPDLGFVTITDVRVTNDLQHASIFYTVFGDEKQRERTAALLAQHRPARLSGGDPLLPQRQHGQDASGVARSVEPVAAGGADGAQQAVPALPRAQDMGAHTDVPTELADPHGGGLG